MERGKHRRNGVRFFASGPAFLIVSAALKASDLEMPPGDRYPEIVYSWHFPDASGYGWSILNTGDFWAEGVSRIGQFGSSWFTLCTDMNRDGWPDLVSPRNAVDYSEPGFETTGTIQREWLFYADWPRQVCVGDFDEDGWKDIAVSWIGIEILRSDGITRWPLHFPYSHLGRTVRYDSILSTDANHDGHLDIVASRYDRFEVDVFHGRGDGTFPDDPDYTLLPPDSTGYRTWRLRLEDLDGDRRLDLFYGDGGYGVIVAWGGEGGFDAPLRLLPSVGRVEGAFDAGDVDLDGDLDVVAATRDAELYLFRNEGVRKFAPGDFLREMLDIGNDLRIQDLSADGNPEVVFLARNLPYFVILRGVADGDYSREVLLQVPETQDDFYFSVDHIQFCGLDLQVIRGDADQDGRIDISDGIRILRFLFEDGAEVLFCPDAADANDDEWIVIDDAVYLLRFLFLGGPPPLSPYPEPGWDWTNRDGSDNRLGFTEHGNLGCTPCWDMYSSDEPKKDRCKFEVWGDKEHKQIFVHVPHPEG